MLTKCIQGASKAVYNIYTRKKAWFYTNKEETKQQPTVWFFQNEKKIQQKLFEQDGVV